jgi:hypothetical protein
VPTVTALIFAIIGGDIKEPNGPPPIADLSDVTLQDGCIFCVALPLGVLIQVS